MQSVQCMTAHELVEHCPSGSVAVHAVRVRPEQIGPQHSFQSHLPLFTTNLKPSLQKSPDNTWLPSATCSVFHWFCWYCFLFSCLLPMLWPQSHTNHFSMNGTGPLLSHLGVFPVNVLERFVLKASMLKPQVLCPWVAAPIWPKCSLRLTDYLKNMRLASWRWNLKYAFGNGNYFKYSPVVTWTQRGID